MIDRVDPTTAGRIMQGIAGAGLAVALAGAVVGWSLVGRLDSAAGDTLALTEEALVTIEDTVVVVEDVVGSTTGALASVEATLAQVVDTTEDAQPLLQSLGDLGMEVAPNLESATETLRTLEGVGGTIDSLLAGLSALPVVPRYDPDTSLSEQFGQLADDIEPLAETLRETSEQIGPAAEGTGELQARLTELQEGVAEVREDLAQSEALLAEYRATAGSAASIATRTSKGLERDVVAARILILLGAATFALAQIVPYWVGTELVARVRDRRDHPVRP